MAKDNQDTGQKELCEARNASLHFLGSVFGFSIFVNLLMLTGPLFMLQIYDRVLGSGSEETLVALFMIVGDRAHIIIKGGFTDFTQLFLNADIHDKGAWRHKVTGSDQLFDRDLVRHVGEDRAQTFFITTVRRGGHAQKLHVWIDVLSVLNHPHIAVSPGVMCFINHQCVKWWQ